MAKKDKRLDNIAFCLPTFNEEVNVEYVVSDIRKVYDGFLFIVDGFSTDNTVAMAEKMNVPVYKRTFNGKGSALQKALEISVENRKEFLMYMDCDRTYSAKDIIKITEHIQDFDLIVGERPLATIEPPYRRWGNIIVTGLINTVFNGKFTDSFSGFKCLRTNKYENAFTEKGFAIDPLLCAYALQYNMRINTIPIKYYKREGESKINFAIGILEFIKFIRALWILKF